MKRPTQEQIDTAVAWLNCNEGEGRERDACEAVALWLAKGEDDRMLRSEARKAGVPVAAVRARMGR
jgi:hypothetical protein